MGPSRAWAGLFTVLLQVAQAAAIEPVGSSGQTRTLQQDLLLTHKGSSCPSPYQPLSAPGCSCTMHTWSSNPASSSSSSQQQQQPTLNNCPAGYRCSPAAAAAIVSAGWARKLTNGTWSVGNITAAADEFDLAAATTGICVPCLLGEYCPVGTQEFTPFSLSCQGATCKGYQACPEGSFCRNPTHSEPCEEGHWCPEGSLSSETCNITNLLAWNPFRIVKSPSQTLLESLVNGNYPLDGNSCPASTAHPLISCPPGYYCPDTKKQLLCPPGHYCQGHNSVPKPCPPLSSCDSPGAAQPDWSWLGLFMMLLLLVLLLMLLEYIRVTGRKFSRCSTVEEDVTQLLAAVGFQMINTQEEYIVKRIRSKRQQQQHQDHSPEQYPSFSRAFLKSVTSRWSSIVPIRNFSHTVKLTGNAGVNFSGNSTVQKKEQLDVHTVNNKDIKRGAIAESDETMLDDVRDQRAAASAAAAAGRGGDKDHTVLTVTGSGDGLYPASPFGDRRAQMGSGNSGGLSKMAIAGAGNSNSGSSTDVNPRLTLKFKDVWVADRSMEGGWTGAVKRAAHAAAAATWRNNGSSSNSDNNRIGSLSAMQSFRMHRLLSSASDHSDKPAATAVDRKLAAAAAAGVNFIVPGVSGKFVHSQLHAIMGPSGCGKTTLCKALAGRIPRSKVLGDIEVLCSSAADGHNTEFGFDVTLGGRAAVDLSHMTGFVPQFDLLHESLTVVENLRVAARLRLPVADSRDHKLSNVSRDRQIGSVVDEVMALMALSKVAHTVVGSSASRRVSGGQRKRTAIGVELVAKPCLLWLDEPTSGLDAAVAADVIGALKQSSERGMNVLAVMHQPRCSIFNMFDSCYLLSAAGHVVYNGPQALCLPYCNFLGFYLPAGENVADFLLDVVTGVVPRPRDPDFIPSQLATFWNRCGDIWVQQQQQQQQQQGAYVLQPAASMPSGPAAAAAAAAAVDWPWRPRELEALLTRFNLLVDTKRQSYSKNMSTSAHFSSETGRLNASMDHVCAAAAAAAGSSQRLGSAAEPVGSANDLANGLDEQSVLTYEGFLGFWEAAGLKQWLSEDHYDAVIEGLCEDFHMTPGSSITQAQFLDVIKSQLRAAADTAAAAGINSSSSVALQPSQYAAERRSTAVDLRSVDLKDCGVLNQQHSEGAVAGAHPAAAAASSSVSPGLLTCASMRLKQYQSILAQQQQLQPETLDTTAAPAGDLDLQQSGNLGQDRTAAHHQQQQQLQQQQLQQQQWRLQRSQMVGRAVMAGSQLAAPRSQQKQQCTFGPVLQDSRSVDLQPVESSSSMETARSAAFQAAPADCQPSLRIMSERILSNHALPKAAAKWQSRLATAATLETDDLETAAVSEDAPSPLYASIKDPAAAAAADGTASATAAAAAALAVGVKSRKLPSVGQQLAVIVVRQGRKWVSSRAALMTDLILTAVLGLALGAAQGRNHEPRASVLWLLIMLLAFGCMSLVRSIHSYGQERHIYFQCESQGGVAVTAWVLGHQLFDLLGLFLHPALFFAWRYVVTLSPVPPGDCYLTLLMVGWYASGLGYVVSLALSPGNALLAGLAVALLLGGVANGVAPTLLRLTASHPLLWLDQLSYTRWGLQALYISWLTPSTAAQAPATAAFLSSLGFCGLDSDLLLALESDLDAGSSSNNDTRGTRSLCVMATRTCSCPAPRLVSALPNICRQPPLAAAQCKSLGRRTCTSRRRQGLRADFSRQSQLPVADVLQDTVRAQRTPDSASIKGTKHGLNREMAQSQQGQEDGAERELLDRLQPGQPGTVTSSARVDIPVSRPVLNGSGAIHHKGRHKGPHKGPSSNFFSSSSWQQLGASAEVVTSLVALGLHRPSHIQAEAFKALSPAAGFRHVVIADQAGSGKTLAYLVPLLQSYKAKESNADRNAPTANCPSLVIMAPTTELAQQVGRVVRALSSAGLRVRTAVMTGGQGEADKRNRTFRTQCEQLAGGVDVLVATPGRLLAHLEKESLRLDEAQAVVMDEVDVLAGTESNYSEYVAPLRAAAPSSTQFVLVSATLPQHTFDQLQELFPGLGVAFGPGLHHTATGCTEELVDCSGGESISLESGTKRKLAALAESLKRIRSTRTMVFCNKIDTCRVVENALKRHGDLGQVLAYHEAVREDLRNAALNIWLSPPNPEEKPKILVCTDRMSRGIDSMWCEHVVLFEFPRDPSEYVRRVGRTARGAGGRGVVTVLVLGKQVALAKEIMDRNRSGAPVHKVPRVWTSN